jgi:LPS-assembly lipoprotein
MWWHRQTPENGRLTVASRPPSVRLAAVAALGALCAGCFQPLYGERTVAGGQPLRAALSSVEIQQIDAAKGTPQERVAVEVRNALIYDMTGGSGSGVPTHRLVVRILPSRNSLIVDRTSARPSAENYGIDAVYVLTDISTGKPVVNGTTFARVSYDIPGQEQRFARSRALRDAEDRAAQVIAENIKNRLASFFIAGT